MDGVCNAFAGQIRTRIWLHLSYLLTLERSHGLKNGKSHFLNFICKTTFYVVHAHSQIIHLNFLFVQCSMTLSSIPVSNSTKCLYPRHNKSNCFLSPSPYCTLNWLSSSYIKTRFGKVFRHSPVMLFKLTMHCALSNEN